MKEKAAYESESGQGRRGAEGEAAATPRAIDTRDETAEGQSAPRDKDLDSPTPAINSGLQRPPCNSLACLDVE